MLSTTMARSSGRTISLIKALKIGDFFLRDRELGSRWRLEGNHELARVGLRKVREAKLGVEQQAGREREKNSTRTVTGIRSARWTRAS